MAKLIVPRLRAITDELRALGVNTELIDEWISEVSLCGHDSMDGIDQAPMNDPAKRWRCSMCSVIGTNDELYSGGDQ